MRVSIEVQNVEMNSTEKVNIKRQAEALFSRVRELVHSVKITLADANGPKGGVDKECTVIINGKTPVPVVVKDKQTTGPMAIHRALQRANFTFLRKIKRQKVIHRNQRFTQEEFEQPM